ncbi:uncharacterized protein [Nicotiana tomentosiformis]|uniref:uncharacterized protein n=1 Tax=Nicotiana tomentosiformis TaxID=4098 RepID=UPI0008789DC6|nr:uncharacterized protein LOC104100335 isoform X2 [Nicotiana tomentosiformis]
MWKYIKEKYDIPDKEKTWAFESIGTAWRKYKKQLKKNHFKAYENAELRMENRPLDVSESHFKDLLKYWNSDPYKAEMERIQSTQESVDGSYSVDAFASVMGPERTGHVRVYGRGITKTVLKRKMRDLRFSIDATDERMKQKIGENGREDGTTNAEKVQCTKGCYGTRNYNERGRTTSTSQPRFAI